MGRRAYHAPIPFAGRSLSLAAQSLSFLRKQESTDAAAQFSSRKHGRGEVSSPAGGGGGRRPEGVYPDITHPLDAEREARQRKTHRRSAQQMQAELRMYARYVNEERLTRTDYLPNRPIPSPRQRALAGTECPHPPNRLP